MSDSDRKTLRLSPKLSEDLANDSKQRGFTSENEYITQAIEHFIKCQKVELSQSMKLIVTKYKGHCLKCTSEIETGSWALHGRGVGLICMNCYVERIGDKALVAKFLKTREFNQIIKALQTEADRLAGQVEVYKSGEKLALLTEQQGKLNRLVLDYLSSKIGSPQEKEALEEILRENSITKNLIQDIEQFIDRVIKTKKWKKVLEKEEYS